MAGVLALDGATTKTKKTAPLVALKERRMKCPPGATARSTAAASAATATPPMPVIPKNLVELWKNPDF